jgi:hypothetical protein
MTGITLANHDNKRNLNRSYEERLITVYVRVLFPLRVCTILAIKAPNLLSMASWSTCPSCKMENRFWDRLNGTNWRKERRIEVFLTLMWSLEPKGQESMFACWCCGINQSLEFESMCCYCCSWVKVMNEWEREGIGVREREKWGLLIFQ